MTDHTSGSVMIALDDFEQLARAARVVASRARQAAQDAGDDRLAAMSWAQAFQIGSVARQMARIIEQRPGGSEEWQRAIGGGALDDVVQALRVSLEQVDPAREVVA